MTWVVVAVGGAAVVGAGASYLGSKKQSDASKAAAGLNMDQFRITNAQQQPFIQSGYGATSKLNTLLGINPNPNAPRMSAPPAMANPSQSVQQAWAPTQGGGVDPRMQLGPSSSDQAPSRWSVPEANMPNLQLRNILALRASHGDQQAQYMLQRLS